MRPKVSQCHVTSRLLTVTIRLLIGTLTSVPLLILGHSVRPRPAFNSGAKAVSSTFPEVFGAQPLNCVHLPKGQDARP